MKKLIKDYEQIINNDPSYIIYSASQKGTSIINLALSSWEWGLLCLWKISKEYLSFFDHRLILLGWNDVKQYNQPILLKDILIG